MKLSADARTLLITLQPYRDISMAKQMEKGFSELSRLGFIAREPLKRNQWWAKHRLTPLGRLVRNLLLEIKEAQNHA